MIGYTSVVEHFKDNFDFLSVGKMFSITEINYMTIYEKDIYKELTIDFLKKKKKKKKKLPPL